MLVVMADRTGWQGERIEEEKDAQCAADDKLQLIGLEAHDVDKPHATDETYCTKDTDGRKVPDGVHACLGEGTISYGITKCQSRHVECYADRVEGEQSGKGHVCACIIAIGCSSHHKSTGQQMAKTKQTLGGNPTVCNNAHKGRHENGNDALHGKKRTDMSGHSGIGEVDAHTG